ncbi:MAG: hypothetical protein WCX65_06675 [bacterium]
MKTQQDLTSEIQILDERIAEQQSRIELLKMDTQTKFEALAADDSARAANTHRDAVALLSDAETRLASMKAKHGELSAELADLRQAEIRSAKSARLGAATRELIQTVTDRLALAGAAKFEGANRDQRLNAMLDARTLLSDSENALTREIGELSGELGIKPPTPENINESAQKFCDLRAIKKALAASGIDADTFFREHDINHCLAHSRIPPRIL